MESSARDWVVDLCDLQWQGDGREATHLDEDPPRLRRYEPHMRGSHCQTARSVDSPQKARRI